ncbi:MAG: mannose-6-phosphate isomerase [Oligoflexia bacterium]|nr:mannose-6-phosphate isomerase [Oligoflexia bacterium]
MSNRETLFKTEPFTVQKIWGASALAQKKGLELTDLGETWEVSNLSEGPSKIDGKGLDTLTDKNNLPYLIKFIDTSDYLSVQVHPGDEYAARVESSSGKTECWIILDAKEGSGIYLGFKEGVTKESFLAKVESEQDVNDDLVFYEVKKGDFFFVPAGAVHAIGKGVTLAEIQQSSGVTYRVWDWNRKDAQGVGRELHIDKALDVLNFEKAFNQPDNFLYQSNVLDKNKELVSHRDFNVQTYTESALINKDNGRYSSFVVLSGKIEISIGEETLSLLEFESAVYLNDSINAQVKASKDAQWLHVY